MGGRPIDWKLTHGLSPDQPDYERGFGIGAQHCGDVGSQVELLRLAKS